LAGRRHRYGHVVGESVRANHGDQFGCQHCPLLIDKGALPTAGSEILLRRYHIFDMLDSDSVWRHIAAYFIMNHYLLPDTTIHMA
jgi:hypothetical protein